MVSNFNKGFLVLALILFASVKLAAQSKYTIITSQLPEECELGSAGLQVDTLKINDTLKVEWSSGQTNVNSVGGLKAGDYSVRVKINHKVDTTINFTIEKSDCKIAISNQFTPNGDNYNDTWSIVRWENFPDFELHVFNKWGQQVHKQKGSYTPWDGRISGVNVPDGTYYYVFYYESGKKKHAKGDVTILR